MHTLELTKEQYINSIPKDISAAIFDNTYQENTTKQFELLFGHVFGDMANDVFWFLYECKPSRCNTIISNGTEYIVKSLDDYLLYAKQEMFNN